MVTGKGVVEEEMVCGGANDTTGDCGWVTDEREAGVSGRGQDEAWGGGDSVETTVRRRR